MSRTRSAGIWLCTALIAAAALTVHLLGVVPLVHPGETWPWGWPVVLGIAFVVTESFWVHLRLGREAYAFSMMELPLVIGLFFVRPDLLVLARVLGSLVAFLVQRKALQKTVFNCALFALETSVAVTVWHWVLQDADPLGPRGWLATLATTLLISALGSFLVSIVIAIATGDRPQVLREVLGLGQVADATNACFALVAVYILTSSVHAAWLLLVLGAVLAFAFRSYEGARQRSESLEQLNRFTEVVGREVELESVVRTVLAEVQAAVGVGSVHLRLRPRDSDEAHRDWCRDGSSVTTDPSHLVDVLADRAVDGSVVVTRRDREPHLVELLERAGVTECVLVPLRSEGRTVGSVALADKLGDVGTFTATDVRQVSALANHAAVAIDNALRAHQVIAAAEERERLALYDELTGLANRRLLRLRLAESLVAEGAAVVLLDLDRFKEVNDTLGHEVGDRLLGLVARRLEEVDAGLVAHCGGDEFALLLPGAGDLRATTCAALVQAALARPFDLDGLPVAVDASLGVAVAAPGTDVSSVLRWADLAMYAAKENRTGVEVYRPELDRQDASRLGLLADLRSAVAGHELAVHYQPKVDLASGRVVGVEALARWEHPRHGTVGPDEFIPLAEHSSLITPLTLLVLRTALHDCERWPQDGGEPLSVAVNISPRSLLEPGFVDAVARALAYSDLGARRLTLEITETSLMQDPDRALAALEALRGLGVRLSVDDLGTGYSSLAYLQRLPVDEVKIDQSFVRSFPDASAQAVVSAIVELGHRLGHRVVAEGVEDAEAYRLLGGLGCDTAQGYWLARPMPAGDLEALLSGWVAPRPLGPLRQVR